LADAYLAGGARFLQVRCKQAASGVFLAVCEDVVAKAHAVGATVIVNDRADIAWLSGADGVHVGQDDLDPAAARRIVGGSGVVGMSTHSVSQARAASAQPVDYIAVGPVFPTPTKETGYADVGVRLVGEVRTLLREAGDIRPIVAIGGITIERARDVIRAGATSVAVISDLVSTGDPEERVRQYLQLLRSEAPGPGDPPALQ